MFDEIPDDLVETITKTKDLFDEFYVVFTDYTGKEERKVEKERRDKDPILFGVFKNSVNVSDRFYFLGDWVDEYCDLTLDKMVEEYKAKKGKDIVVTTEIPATSEELLERLKSYKIDDKKGNGFIISLNEAEATPTSRELPVSSFKFEPSKDEKPSFFKKIRSVFAKDKK